MFNSRSKRRNDCFHREAKSHFCRKINLRKKSFLLSKGLFSTFKESLTVKILVLVKEIIDTNSKIVFNKQKKLDESQVKWVVNLYDEYALEEAIRIKEQFGGEVVIYSVGNDRTKDTLNYIMSMGADRAVLIKSELTDAKSVSEILAKQIREKDADFDLILAGWIGIDWNRGQVPGRVSSVLEVPFVNVVIDIDINGKIVTCEKEGESSNEIIDVQLPALITVQRGINEPRYPSVLSIMDNTEKKIEIVDNIDQSTTKKAIIKIEPEKNRKKTYMINESDPELAVKMLMKKMIADKVM
ncbi:MAG TPA: electron transfer flavoprotein subunit beta [Clostridiales bacterium]|nr:electron transfer flavoprotein subunit beta [Clostridiales bacterium]